MRQYPRTGCRSPGTGYIVHADAVGRATVGGATSCQNAIAPTDAFVTHESIHSARKERDPTADGPTD